MLSSFIALLGTLTTEMPSWDPASLRAIPVRATGPVLLPDEPATLVLAVIGIGIIGAYAGVKRWRRTKQQATILRSTATDRHRTAEKPKRSAA